MKLQIFQVTLPNDSVVDCIITDGYPVVLKGRSDMFWHLDYSNLYPNSCRARV